MPHNPNSLSQFRYSPHHRVESQHSGPLGSLIFLQLQVKLYDATENNNGSKIKDGEEIEIEIEIGYQL